MNASSDLPDSSVERKQDQEAEPVKEIMSVKSSPAFEAFAEKFASFQVPEEKVAYGLEFMRSSISQEGSPRFKEFWEARRQILPCFKENLNPAIRSKLWGEYVELTVEARKLKEILEEQSAFAMEQIDLAVQSLETDLANFEVLLEQSPPFSFLGRCDTIADKMASYGKLQRELNLLNALASRVNALRKEVVKTDMRIRFKAKLFKRLSELGDQIFPKRKDLIEKVSAEFEHDIDEFIVKNFKGGVAIGTPYYALREEIKALQGMAKVFTLSSGVFNRTRLKLSECWDQVKTLEKEHKKERTEKKQASSQQRLVIEKQIEELKARSAEMSLRDLDKEIDGILREMRDLFLHRDDIRGLRDEIFLLRAPHVAAQEQKQRELEAAEREALRIKRETIVRIKESVAALQKEGAQLELDAFSIRYDEILQQLNSLEISKIEKQQLERSLKPLKDLLVEKKEQSLINLSEDDRKALENLKMVLQQKKERRQEIKETLESYRKTLGGSNLDFDRAMQIRELIDQEKERLEKANSSIQEIEGKIAELES